MRIMRAGLRVDPASGQPHVLDKRVAPGEAHAMSQTPTPYARFENTALILRDELAVDRTRLANERTLLAYLRSAMALAIAGASIMHFSNEGWFWLIGLLCLPLGAFTGIIGTVRYRTMERAISVVRGKLARQADAPQAASQD
jgi:putative membrane protein